VQRSTVALIAIITVTGCRSKATRQPESDSVPNPALPAAVTIGAGASPVYPKRLVLESDLRPDSLLAVPGTNLAAVSGEIDGRAALQLIDIDAATVVWTDTRWCNGRLVHATADRLLCSSGKGVQAIAVADGQPAWSSPRTFRAASGDRVLAGTALIDVKTGKVERAQEVEPPYLKYIQRLCPDGAVYAWLPSGVLMRLSQDFDIEWNRDLGAAPTWVDACGTPALFEVPAGDEQRLLIALDPSTGDPVADKIDVLGWWTALDGDGLVIADAAGLHQRSRTLGAPTPIAPARVAGRAIADGPGTRLVRTVGGTLLLLDREGIRAWMAAPTAPRAAVLTGERLLSAGWAVDRSAGERIQLYELPTARMPWPKTAMERRPGAEVAQAELTALPEPSEIAAAVEIADAAHGKHGVSAIAVAGGFVYAVVLERSPSGNSGGALAAFDLRKREWSWYQADGCAVDTSVLQVAVVGGSVVCATRTRTDAAELVAVDASTGAPRWRRKLAAIDRLAAAGDHLVAFVGERALALDPATGEVAREIMSDNGHAPRVAVVAEGIVAVEQGDLVGPGWRVHVDGHVTALSATEDAVLAMLAGGALYALDPATGTPTEVTGWSASADLVVAGDRYFDYPASPEGTFVIRGYARAAQTLRVTLPQYAQLVSVRSGSGAPVLLVDDRRAAYVIEIDPATGRAAATYPWPTSARQAGGFSTVVDGTPVAGVVLRRPLSVHLFPR